jgi:RNA-binding protein 8A
MSSDISMTIDMTTAMKMPTLPPFAEAIQTSGAPPTKEADADAAGFVHRGHGGAMMGVDRGPVRGGAFDALAVAGEPGAPAQSVENWVVALLNLPSNTTVEDLKDLVAGNGPYADLRTCEASISVDVNAGYAFVSYPTRDQAAALIAGLNGMQLPDGRALVAEFAFVHPPAGAASPTATQTAAGRKRDRD